MPGRVVRILISGIAFVAQLNLFAQDGATPKNNELISFWSQGLPYITSYTSRDYKVGGQNWAVTQDKSGLIYVGNTNGILQFDGVNWRLIKAAGNSPVKSLATDRHGRVFAGGVNEIGYLEPGHRAGVKYHSLLSELEVKERAFGDVWVTHAIQDTIYFVTDTHLIRWAGNEAQVWREKSFGFSWTGRGALWIQIEGKGLHRMTANGPTKISAFDADFTGQSVTAGLPNGQSGWTLITSNDKAYSISDHGIKTAIHDFSLPEGFVYRSTRLPDGNYALGCLDGGLYIAKSDGTIINHYTRRDGLTSNTIVDVFVDATGDLWLAADKGLMRVEWDSPLRRFDTFQGIDEEVNDVAVFRNQLYAATTSGLYVLSFDPKDSRRRTFLKVPHMEYLTSDLEVVGDQMIIGNYFGLFCMNDDGKINRLYDQNVHTLGAANSQGDYLLFATATSVIGELIKDGNSWKRGADTLVLNGRPSRIERSRNGNVVIGTRYQGVYELRFPATMDKRRLADIKQVVHYDTTRGLPSMVNGLLIVSGDKPLLPSAGSIYSLDNNSLTFRRFESVMQHFPIKDTEVQHIEQSGGDAFWLTVNQEGTTSLFRYRRGLLRKVPAGNRFLPQRLESMFAFDGVTFFSTGEGLVVYNEMYSHTDSLPFATRIRKVLVNRDSVLAEEHPENEPRFGYALNSPGFEFALPNYEQAEANEYQFMLEGYDDRWSRWSTLTHANFTHLFEGHYTFRVRGRNSYGRIGDEAMLSFVILPPIYRAWWAYALYAIALLIIIKVLADRRSKRLELEKERLERLVSERTKEVMVQAERLKEMDAAKSRFYANISHEFRTPLTLILAPFESRSEQNSLTEEKWLMMKRNARRLLELVNQLLDLSKLDAGRMELRVKNADVGQQIVTLSSSFESLAEHRDIRFIRNISIDSRDTWCDSDKLEKIVSNLLSNALKFTPAGGVVFLEATLQRTNGLMSLVITVSDTGRGISSNEKDRIFSPFYQVRHSSDENEQGTGLGLSLVKELTMLHHGTIELDSREKVGSTFVVTLPVNMSAFSVDELVESGTFANGAESIDSEFPAKTTDATIANDDTSSTLTNQALSGSSGDTVITGRNTVVVVEDNYDLRSFISSLLGSRYTVLTACDGEEGYSLTRDQLPDLVLSDLMMPKIDGMQLTERLKQDERTSHIPVVLLTARNESSSKLDSYRIGADDYLTKPFSAEELLVRIDNLIAQRKKLSERFRQKVLVEPTPKQHESLEEKFLFAVRDVVESQLSDPDFGVDQLAEAACLSRTQLFRKLHALTGLSPSEFIRDLRLKHAADLIAAKADTVTQIGYRVGFRDQSYFTKCFKKQFGVSPSVYSRT
ncbi:ATP-binding protein [Chryseolinea sp. T2]|uniref:hybrid sensor histidine kinase/response regulator transcription factor n=1 Tax=Chryseolinea sp. T2 TaxID=3129255 RepID=UPI003077F486